ncbi:MAG: dipicolinate synthase subunit B [Oscillospiraceae bacterium]|nr:dipicolinate synthase subunit B [Oscillospiraceae bacterium]MDD3261363.1 dipicolinate synthase subunit B [Oscillospiraceae bacterium]
MDKAVLGFAMCGSFCTFSRALEQMRILKDMGYDILPIMSETAAKTDTRFGRATDFLWQIEDITGRIPICSIPGAEPIGPKKMADLVVVAPCTGNTLAKLANGVTDTAVTMAVKSNLRVHRPVLLTIATNDALAASAQNIGRLLNVKHVYFTPFRQDDHEKKPSSAVADFTLLPQAVEQALQGQQMQPILLAPVKGGCR